ncbi:hypothetical protein MASR2M74_08710 [Paracoccaceae bacterium]
MRRLALALSLLATPALAESPRAAMFPSDASCYLRHYDKAHLASHPQQQVSEIAIGPQTGSFESDVLSLTVALSLRGVSEIYTRTAYCENTGGSLSCQMEGDAGWFTLTPRKKGAVLLEVGKGGLVFEGRNFIYISGTMGDDREFLLPPVPADSCP